MESVTRHASRYREAAVCIALICLVLLSWAGFGFEHGRTLQARAAVHFMRHHHAIGDDPRFIVQTAPYVVVPWTEVLRSTPFMTASLLAILSIGALSWLAYRLVSDNRG